LQAVEENRTQHQNRLTAATAEAKLTLERTQRQQELDFQRAAAQQNLELKQRTHDIELAQRQAENREQLTYLQGIAGLKVDVTRYLVAQYQHPDKIIRIDGGADAQLHLHEQGA
jgi:hypothetical protein